MKNQASSYHKTNQRITKRVIELHEKGYHMDFHYLNKESMLCLQDNNYFDISELAIMVVDQVYDQFTRSFKYIHTVETTSGYRGVLLCDMVYTGQATTPRLSAKSGLFM